MLSFSWLEKLSLQLLCLSFGKIGPVVGAFHFHDHLLHLFTLSGPFFGAHFQILPEQLVIWLSVATKHTVKNRGELAVVVIDWEKLEGYRSVVKKA